LPPLLAPEIIEYISLSFSRELPTILEELRAEANRAKRTREIINFRVTKIGREGWGIQDAEPDLL